MRRILLIAKRDFLESIRSKAFIIGLVVLPILFGGGFLGIGLMKAKPDITDKRIAILDHAGGAAGSVIQAAQEKNARELFDKTTGRQVIPRYLFEPVQADDAGSSEQRLALSDRVRRGDLFALVEIPADALRLPKNTASSVSAAGRVAYYTNAGGIDEVQRWLAGPVREGIERARLAALGVDPGRFEELFRPVSLERMSLVSRDERTGAIVEARKKGQAETFAIPFTVMMLLAMIVMATSGPMLPAVSEDKIQRVYEMLLGSATPFELMMGKVLAAIGRSLISSVFYVIGATLVLQSLAMTGMAPFALLPWFFVYLVADVMILCAFATALGAACGSPQDAQNLGILLLSPVLIPLFLMLPVLQQPNGALATTLSLFPPFTPLLMLMRQAMPGGMPAWQPWVGLIGVLACTLAITFAAARVFRIAILLQGKPPRAAELLHWALRG